MGRWLSRDPQEEKYPSLAPYIAFANNSLYWIDPGGETLSVAGKPEQALTDLRSLVPKEIRPFITLTDQNLIEFDITKVPEKYQNYQGVQLVNKLVTSGKNYLYEVGNDVQAVDPVTGQRAVAKYTDAELVASPREAIHNFSATPINPITPADYLAPKGYDGYVQIAPGSFSIQSAIDPDILVSVPRSNLVFHELMECYYRTETPDVADRESGYSYALNGGMYYEAKDETGKGGAHEAAGVKGKIFVKELKQSNTLVDGNAPGKTLHYEAPK
ncbi:MAG: hypothetical protein M3Q97_02265 [Bacteroidota bacterium]|nr:hypothetical protein [Bacteroidota bacterium]